MIEQEFWKLISLLNWKKTGDDKAVLERAVKRLAKMSLMEIASFEEMLHQKLHALDTKSHAQNIGEYSYENDVKYFSVDWFLYARCCVVANGRELYAAVLQNPKEFPKDVEFEALLYLASKAWEFKTQEECMGFATSVSYETFSNKSGWI